MVESRSNHLDSVYLGQLILQQYKQRKVIQNTKNQSDIAAVKPTYLKPTNFIYNNIKVIGD